MICLIDEWIRQFVVLLLGVFYFGGGGGCWVQSEDVLKGMLWTSLTQFC